MATSLAMASMSQPASKLWPSRAGFASRRGFRKMPRRVGSSLWLIGHARFLSRRFAEAVPKLLLAIQDDPSVPSPYRTLAACYAHMGRLNDAQEIVTRL